MKLAFAGLGVMGFPMAGHLAKAGHELVVYNRTREKADRWVDRFGGEAANTVAEAAEDCDVFLLCVGADHDVRQVVEEALTTLPPAAVVVDHTTTSAELARELSSKVAFVDAPVSGGQAGAENGQLTVMCGGQAEIFEHVRPIVEVYAKAVRWMGPPGSGQLTKMANQICIAGVVQGLAEALHFSLRAGLDPMEVYGAISQGSAQSWQMDNRWKTMTENKFDFGFAVDWMRKDLGLVLDEADRNGAQLALTRMVDGFYAEVQQAGGRRWDTSSLVTRLER